MKRISIVLFALPWFALGCDPPEKPPLQTVPKNSGGVGSGLDETLEPPNEAEKQTALSRLEKAIAAHGGGDRLKMLQCQIQNLTGTLHDEQTEQEIQLHFPKKLRLKVTKRGPMGGIDESIVVMDGEAGWFVKAGSSHEMPSHFLRDVKSEMVFRWILTLLPLRDAGVIVRPVDGPKVNNRPTNGIRVQLKDHPVVNLYFDTETGLLVRSFGQWKEALILQNREITFSNHKQTSGLMLPGHLIESRDGKVWYDCDVAYRFPASLDQKDFVQP